MRGAVFCRLGFSYIFSQKGTSMGATPLSGSRIIAAFGIVLFAGLSFERLDGQAATASITGTITDSSGAVIVGAAVNAKNSGTGITRTTVSDAQGRYTLPDLAIGDYDVEAEMMGFQSVVRKGV